MAENPGVMFDEPSANKIAGVVTKFRQFYQRTTGQPFGGIIHDAFWVKVNGATSGANGWEHTAKEVNKSQPGQTWDNWPDPDTLREATGLSANGIALYTVGDVRLADDSVVLAIEVIFPDPDDDTFQDAIVEWWTTTGGGSGGDIFRVSSVSAVHGFFRGHLTKSPTVRAWRPVIVSGADTQTLYIDGTPFANGDYAQNLSDHIVYHRESGAWVNAAGHLTDTDWDDVAGDDLDVVASDLFVNTGDEVILADLRATTLGNSEDVDAPLAVGELVLGSYRTTRSDGVKCYAVTGRFRFRDGQSDGVIVEWWDGNYQRSKVRLD